MGRRTSMVDPNGNTDGATPSEYTWTTTYDAEDRVLTLSAPAPTPGGGAVTTEFQYDAVGNRIVVIDANGQVTKTSTTRGQPEHGAAEPNAGRIRRTRRGSPAPGTDAEPAGEA